MTLLSGLKLEVDIDSIITKKLVLSDYVMNRLLMERKIVIKNTKLENFQSIEHICSH